MKLVQYNEYLVSAMDTYNQSINSQSAKYVCTHAFSSVYRLTKYDLCGRPIVCSILPCATMCHLNAVKYSTALTKGIT